MGSVEVVEVLPFLELVVEYVGFVDDDPFEHSVELFVVYPVRSFDFAVEARSCRFDVDVSDPSIQDVIVELGLKLCAVVGLDCVDPERQLLQEIVEELDRGLLVALGIDTQHPEPCAVVNGSELVEPFPCPANRRDELDVNLHGVTGLLLLVTLPAFLVRLVLLGRWQSVQVEPIQDPPHPRWADPDLVIPLEIH